MKLAEDLRRSVLQVAIEGKLTGGSRESWRFVRLDEIGEIIGGGTPNTLQAEYWTHGRIAWITPADMGKLKSKYISHGARNITEKGLASSSARMMPKGSIIFSSRAPIGYIAIAENDLCTNQGCKSVRLYDGILSEYVYFALLAIRDDIKKMGSGTTFKEISGRVFSSVIIPLPSIEEQRRIVSRLDAILPLIAELESAENELAELERRFPGDMRDSLLQAAIEGRLTGSNTDNWRWVRLGEISLSIQYGYNAPAREKGSVKMVRISDIQNNNIQWDNVPYCEISEEEMQKYLLSKNDILFARTGSVGKSYLVGDLPEVAIYAGYLIRVRISDEVNPQYIKYFMESESYWKQIRKGTTKTVQPNCNGKKLSQIIIPLPPIDEQHKIAARLNELLPLCEVLEKIT